MKEKTKRTIVIALSIIVVAMIPTVGYFIGGLALAAIYSAVLPIFIIVMSGLVKLALWVLDLL